MDLQSFKNDDWSQVVIVGSLLLPFPFLQDHIFPSFCLYWWAILWNELEWCSATRVSLSHPTQSAHINNSGPYRPLIPKSKYAGSGLKSEFPTQKKHVKLLVKLTNFHKASLSLRKTVWYYYLFDKPKSNYLFEFGRKWFQPHILIVNTFDTDA